MAANPVKKAASLILCRQSKRLDSFYDYQILMLSRKQSMRSFGSMLAFPGGKLDQEKDVRLSSQLGLQNVAYSTMLRQCFEETGLYLSKDPLFQTSKISDLNQIKLEYIAAEFQKYKTIETSRVIQQIHQQDQKRKDQQNYVCQFFQKLARIIPPKNTFLPFVRLITVPAIKVRFDAEFYIHKLEQFKLINFLKYAENEKYLHSEKEIVMSQEFSSFKWYTPVEVIKGFFGKSIKLAPPQFIMLNILSAFQKYEQLNYYLKKCSHNETNMGPNVISIVKNNGYLKQQFPYAATLLGDYQFPFQFCKKTEKNQYLIDELSNYQSRLAQSEEPKKNRILFKKPHQFFEEKYGNQCTIEDSIMNKFMSWEKLEKLLELYQ